jgi:hypothetical protein
MQKRGTLKIGVVEATPVVWQDRLLRFEWVRSDKWAAGQNQRDLGYYHFVDMETEEEVGKPFAFGGAFGCCYEENGMMYAHGVAGNGDPCRDIDVYYSSDLIHWESKRAITLPDFVNSAYNTSVCKDADGYVMAIEVDGDRELLGRPYTMLFAKSKNLLDWELLPVDQYVFYKERYSACPSIRFYDGQYYIVYLEALPFASYTPYVVRTPDLCHFEVAVANPFMMFDDNDKQLIFPERFTDEEKAYVRDAVDCNNSDVDFCDYHGKAVILYSWGNQLGKEFLALAEYDGSLEELLKSFF